MYKFFVEEFSWADIGHYKPKPNLSKINPKPYTPEWRTFSTTYPFSEPVMLFEYMNYWGVNYRIVDEFETDNNTFYPIALSYYDFSIDWFSLMSYHVRGHIRDQQLRVLFYYSEGDNPHRINEHITEQCEKHNIPREQVYFISANSAAKDIPYFFHFVDDELLFNFRNKSIIPEEFHKEPRRKKFTALSRMHKYWRANTMTRIWQSENYDEGYFSYNTEVSANESEDDNPIEVDNFGNLRTLTRLFLNGCPYVADTMTSDAHNTHTMAYPLHFNDSYINIVLESHMDVDQSGGAYLTEKTFKPIKNAQPFIIFGAQGSLQVLRDLGYRTFDGIIDNYYDLIENTTERWEEAINLTLRLIQLNKEQLHDLFCACEDDLLHNQQLFLESKYNRLTQLLEEIYEPDQQLYQLATA